MPENNNTPVEDTESSNLPTQGGVMDTALLVSFIIYLIGSVPIALSPLGLVGFVYGFIILIIALPFAVVTVLIYRKTQLPLRFELLTSLLVSGVSVIVVFVILLWFIL
jgi:hypothetical protein